MSGVAYDYIEDFIRSFIPEKSALLNNIERYAIQNNVPIIHKEVAAFLDFMINIKKPKTILELGTAIGYSSIYMCECTNGNAEIVTIERDIQMINLAKENFKEYKNSRKINLIEGDCLEVLKTITDRFDMIFIDAGKGHYNHFLPYCLKLLTDDGLIIADNVLFKGMVASKELLIRRKITIVKRMKKYLQMICSDNKLITTILPMGDGIAVTARRSYNEET